MDQNIERINYITDYLTNYNQYMASLNKLGLTDAAILFEMFAEKVCSLWFGQAFHNLNVAKANYPYVDLISADEQIFVQVSTVQNVPAKIKNTLENIRDAVMKDPNSNAARLTSVKFFVAGNDSVRKVRNYTGNDKIGNVEFQSSQDLITFQTIIERCKNEEAFLRELYAVLHDRTDSYKAITKSISDAVERSKNLIDKTIVSLIGGKYEIDRSGIIKTIESEGKQFVSIEGQAGTGKSALCKMLLKEKEIVLFARAEKFGQTNALCDVWNMDVKEALKFLSGKKIYFYIDALEYISDCSRTTQDLLVELYSLVQNHKNAYILTSCRTSEKTAFSRITATFNVTYYTVPELTDNQVFQITQLFPTVKQYVQNPSYKELFRIPFNIELLVSHAGKGHLFTDANSFRTFVWNSVICLDGKVSKRNFTKKDVRDTVNSIVFTRASEFSVGVSEENYDPDIIELLLSNNVLISNDGNVRLKYDIYEDICFERKIDSIFGSVRGNYVRFFSELEKLGRCVHRRYQIWIENKLFSKDARRNFLYRIMEDSSIPAEWHIQTLTGIIKSNSSTAFFDDFKDVIIKSHIETFINIANCRSFELNIIQLKDGNAFSQLVPCGKGRSALIRMVFDEELYKNNDRYRTSIIKLCSDYANTNKKEKAAALDASIILEYYADQLIQTEKSHYVYGVWEELNNILNSIYLMAEYSATWIKDLWKKTIENYRKSARGISQKMIESVVKSPNEIMLFQLARYLSKDLLGLEDAYWTISDDQQSGIYYPRRYEKECLYGLNNKSTHYSFDFDRAEKNHLFNVVAIYDFWDYLKWVVNLTNNAAQKYTENLPDEVRTVSIIDSEGVKHQYIGCQEFWNAGVDETAVPELIGDAIYDLIQAAVFWIKKIENSANDLKKFADSLKKIIISTSNNIMMLTVIEEVGFLFRNTLPGYAIELASSIDLIHFDIVKYAKTHTTASQKILEKYILLTVSMPESALRKRYDRGEANDYTLQIYMMTEQLTEDFRTKAEAVLDYLYSIIPDSEQTADDYLQIQKMDLRLAKKEEINSFIYRYVPQLTGNAKTLVEEARKRESMDGTDEVSALLSDVTPKIENNTLTVDEVVEVIDKFTAMRKRVQFTHVIEDNLALFWAYALSRDDLPDGKRSEYCNNWIAAIESLLLDGNFHFEPNLSPVLFKQLRKNIGRETSNTLKKLCYDLMRYDDSNGIILQIRSALTSFLNSETHDISQLLFNTCLALLSQKEIAETEIIEEYLYCEKQIEIDLDLLENFDFSVGASFIDCGLKFSNSAFKQFVQTMVRQARDRVNDDYMEKDHHALYQVENFFSNKIINCDESDDVLEALFVDFDSVKKNRNLFDFYDGCFSNFLAAYFDAKSSPDMRMQYENLISKLEQHIGLISDENARKEMYRYMFLTLGKYHFKDWNELDANYSLRDKHFLTTIWSKYGKYHPRGLLSVVYQMHIRELLPEILFPLQDTLTALRMEGSNSLDRLVEDRSNSFVLNEIVSDIYLYFYDQVRNDEEYSNAFINILQVLKETSFSGAGVIMDEFLGH